jgi:hypothetical protein
MFVQILIFHQLYAYGPICFRFSQTRLDYKLSEDFLASRFSLLVVQISEADYHRRKNKQSVWWC